MLSGTPAFGRVTRQVGSADGPQGRLLRGSATTPGPRIEVGCRLTDVLEAAHSPASALWTTLALDADECQNGEVTTRL